MNIRTICLLMAIFCLIFVIPKCSVEVAGGGSEGEAKTISVRGSVFFKDDGKPAVLANVYIRKKDFLKNATIFVGYPKPDAVVQSNGTFCIDSVDTGDFRIEINYKDKFATIIDIGIDGSSLDMNLTPDTLDCTGSVTGYVPIDSFSDTVFVQVYGLERFLRVDSSVELFTFKSLPPGEHLFRISTSSDIYTPLVIPVIVQVGIISNLDTISIESDTNENLALWQYRRLLICNTTSSGAKIEENVRNFPLLIRLNSSNFTFSDAQGQGNDIRFCKSDSTPIYYEIEMWDSVSSRAAVWVMVDTIYGNAQTEIYMYWGCKDAPERSNSAMVFDTANGFSGVWHLNEGAGENRSDATANKFDGIPQMYDGDENSSGGIGGCDSIGDDDVVVTKDIDIIESLTLSIWIYPTEIVDWGHVFSKAWETAESPWYSYAMQFDSSGGTDHSIIMGIVTENGNYGVSTETSVSLNKWLYVTGVYTGSSLRIYMNGILEDAKPVSGLLIQNDKKFYIGSYEYWLEQRLIGKMDEVRISGCWRNEYWIKLSYENQKPDSDIIELGESKCQ